MKKILCLAVLFVLTLRLAAQVSTPRSFHLLVFRKEQRIGKSDTLLKRRATFVEGVLEPSKKNIKCLDPGASGHLTILVKDQLHITGGSDSLEALLKKPGSYVYIFQNTDLIDTTRFLTLIADSTTSEHFLGRIPNIKKREWETYRILIQPRSVDSLSHITYAMYLRFQPSLFTLNLPNKSNRETIQVKSISPAIPVIHLGSIDYTQYQFGPGISFNFGPAPTRPLLRLASDLVGPVSMEWMFHPINSIRDVGGIHSSAVGLFFNSLYGIFHWGIAWYTPSYSRAEAYIGINLMPAIQLYQSRGKQRYKW